ncbi:MAG: flagellar basal body P-ring formation protein FlgA [Rhizobacter sp.]|nr:flagellar basal body P-ring formation protein FlgA [Rhizobacter sp.]
MLPIALLAPLLRFLPRNTRALAWAFAAVAIALAAAAATARADEPTATVAPGVLNDARSLALELATTQTAFAHSARIEVVVGALDQRLHLAPCDRIEPFLPPGVRLWGRSRIGLHCKEGRTNWSVYLPIVVKVWGSALVVPAGAAANSVVADADLAEAEVDLAEESTPVFVDRKAVVGRTLAQALRPGQAIRQAHLKTRQWFAVGETVKVVAVGDGFALESAGQAVTNGIEGQPARVRTDGGRIVTGVATGERRLELTL